MQVLKNEFEKLSSKYGQQELYLDGFAPEQIYYQIEDLCDSILENCEGAINRLYPHFERIEKLSSLEEEKICDYGIGNEEGECLKGTCEKINFEQDSDLSGSNESGEKTDHETEESEHSEEEEDEENEGSLLLSEDFDVSDNEISQMPAEDAIKLLTSRVRKNPNLYIEDESCSDSEESQ